MNLKKQKSDEFEERQRGLKVGTQRAWGNITRKPNLGWHAQGLEEH